MIYCCKEHVELALDVVVDEHEMAPVLTEIPEEKQLSTPCEYCRNTAIYMVGN
ncbi:CxxH/CxxC protein [Peribacillus saganii]|uniref:CxxH/CxxC protein n=1 Tax=Peribacillus saganii TaxID=2303992 RepID=A0A372LLS4_9BACI|nr:CxxH/CxxC protein [Peribacillus saganii]RFU67286.1 CxxH/CxxC protein [Peribacillus saganii]